MFHREMSEEELAELVLQLLADADCKKPDGSVLTREELPDLLKAVRNFKISNDEHFHAWLKGIIGGIEALLSDMEIEATING